MLSKRYINDGISEWELNPIQLQYRDQLLEKINKGVYKLEKVKKCLCGSNSFEKLSEKDRYGLPFGTVICKNCGLILTTPRLSKESLPKFYESEYHFLLFGTNDPKKFKMYNENQGIIIYDYIKNYIKEFKKLKVAEIGCGVGYNLKLFKEKTELDSINNVEVYGCDYSKSCIDVATNILGPNVVVGGVESLKNLGIKFDLIILSHVLEHFVDIPLQLNLISQMMNNNSLLYIEVPGLFDLQNKIEYKCDFLRYTVCAHIYHFSLGTLTNVFNMNYFELVKANEFVQSIFKKTSKKIDNKNYYNKTVEFLSDLERNRAIYFLLKSEVQKYRREILNKNKIILEKEAVIMSLQNSISWRLTAPLRTLRRFFQVRN